MSPLLKNLSVALGIALIAGLAYYVIAPSDTPTDELGSGIESEALLKTAKIRADTTKINEYKVNGEILRDDRFRSLMENNIDALLTDTGSGRSNPFEAVR